MNGLGWNFVEGSSVVQQRTLNFDGDLSLLRWVNEQKYIITVAWPDRSAGNDPEPLGLAFYHQGNAMHSNIVATS